MIQDQTPLNLRGLLEDQVHKAWVALKELTLSYHNGYIS